MPGGASIRNKLFQDLSIGETASMERSITGEDIRVWASITGNFNINEDLSHGYGIAAAWATTMFSTLIGTRLPGTGSVIKSASVEFVRPIHAGDRVTVTVAVKEKKAETGTVVLECRCVESGRELITIAFAEVAPPTERIEIKEPSHNLDLLVNACNGLPPVATAVVHPCSAESLIGAIEAWEAKLITPVLVGPEARIREIAAEHQLDIAPFALVSTQFSQESAEKAAILAGQGKVHALMKGSLHSDEFLHGILVKEAGLRTDRRLSHVFLISVPTYSRRVIVTDAAMNIAPDLDAKKEIAQNAIIFARSIGIEQPKVAAVCAVEEVKTTMQSTLDAAALAKMGERKQIEGGIVDGPLAFDNAVDPEAARIKGIVSPVAGSADILLVHDIETGNAVAKQLTFMADAQCAGLVLGARVPIILTSRADSPDARRWSAALAVLYSTTIRDNPLLLKLGR